jgi:small subunit ribosomal protein S1
VVNEGETVSVTIKDVDLIKRRISLSLRDAEGDPWLEVPEKFPVGKTIQGTIEKKADFGFFVSVAPGITGLLPKSKISKSYDAASIEKLKEGAAIFVVVEEVNPWERKMTLGPGGDADTQNWQDYSKDTPSSMGALGEKLQEAMKRKRK